MSDRYRTLLLLRHAKSDYPDGVADHDRPLAPRGIREGALAGEWIAANVGTVDAVLCSSATRTRQTLERTGITAPVEYVDRIYDATPGIVIEEINAVQSRFDADVSTLLVVGHEPVMSMLAMSLADEESSSGPAAQKLSAKFPTSSIAVLRVSSPWDQVAMRGAELVDFHTAR
ncbi:putative phosphohistidine phosphatase, SixA [Mycolicibacterium aurum]|uniref:Putative phosphohistidine phosphatase, SixA n=1 Tax=Mycolicibacterium aurum TaxID=1791 RepID=A0A3S4VRK7_MYCAU|nr:histidine phosphatase family protein [Mycolicibacterium aurum]VEG57158.1 putative phosphohistidine phosphatase, SixA [Mycolicibacterium aurum]